MSHDRQFQQRLGLFAAVFMLLWAGLLSTSGTAQLVEVPLMERAQAASLIVEGQVVAKESFWAEGQTTIFTSYVVEVYKILKDGSSALARIELLEEGGQVGNERVDVYPGLTLEVGDVGLFFLAPVTSRGFAGKVEPVAFEAFAGVQGFVAYKEAGGAAADPFQTYEDLERQLYAPIRAAVGGALIEVKSFDADAFLAAPKQHDGKAQGAVLHTFKAPAITAKSVVDMSPTAGVGEVLTIDGTGFTDGAGGGAAGMAAVLFDDADDGSGGDRVAIPFGNERIMSFTDTKIEIKMPENAGTGDLTVRDNAGAVSGTTPLTFDYGITNEIISDGGTPGFPRGVFLSDLYNDNGAGGYTFTYESGFAAAAKAAFARAGNSLTCNASIFVNWTLAAADTAPKCPVSDEINGVSFDGPACELSAGTLGRATTRSTACSDGTDQFWRVREKDIQFDGGTTWQFGPADPAGGENDFESVALHELGHLLGLAHVNVMANVMHFSLTTGTKSRVVTAEMTGGGGFMMMKSTAAHSPTECEAALLPMTAKTAGACSIPVELSAFDAVADGDEVLLTWQTASEANNAGFEVQRRYLRGAYEKIAFVEGAGTTTQPQRYELRTDKLEPGRYTFRLKQIDFDGAFDYSPVVEVTVEMAERFLLAPVYPNPFNPSATVRFAVKEAVPVRAALYDALGREVQLLFAGTPVAGEMIEMQIDGTGLVSGLYVVRLTGEGIAATQPVTLVK